MNVVDVQIGSPVWAVCPGLGWQAAVVQSVGRRRDERTRVTIAFETGYTIVGTRTPGYLRKRDRAKAGSDRPSEQVCEATL